MDGSVGVRVFFLDLRWLLCEVVLLLPGEADANNEGELDPLRRSLLRGVLGLSMGDWGLAVVVLTRTMSLSLSRVATGLLLLLDTSLVVVVMVVSGFLCMVVVLANLLERITTDVVGPISFMMDSLNRPCCWSVEVLALAVKRLLKLSYDSLDDDSSCPNEERIVALAAKRGMLCGRGVSRPDEDA